MPISEIARQAAELSRSSDRYLFIVALLVMGAGTVIAIRYLVRMIEKMSADHRTDHEACEDKLAAIAASQNDSRERLIVVTEQNTRVLQECTAHLARLRNI